MKTAKPVRIIYDSKVSADKVTVGAIRDVVKTLSKEHPDWKIKVIGDKYWGTGSFSSADWFVSNANTIVNYDGIQVSADHLLRLLAADPRQETKPFICVLFTADHLTVLGKYGYEPNQTSVTRGRSTVFSTTQLKRNPKKRHEQVATALKKLLKEQRRIAK